MTKCVYWLFRTHSAHVLLQHLAILLYGPGATRSILNSLSIRHSQLQVDLKINENGGVYPRRMIP